ncbi:MAG: hypothetical protein FWE41_00375 [Coriobacteriia bacterium]|nr:hypothetical protein [Coriobacteriia bacterium]MCL2749680.1 hypothetical protein [Coriobacteriia bacterium]
MRDEAVKDYIRQRSGLFWYSPEDKGETVPDDLLVEQVLNYGTLDDVKDLFRVLGVAKVSDTFFKSLSLSERRKNNYSPITVNYFTLLFNRYV